MLPTFTQNPSRLRKVAAHLPSITSSLSPFDWLHHPSSLQSRESGLLSGTVPFAFLSGLHALKHSELELLAVPVHLSERSAQQPIYHSDIVVRWDSHFDTWQDLAGAHWAYSTPSSLSSLLAPLFQLGMQEVPFQGFFAPAGSPFAALEQVLHQQADAVAVHSLTLTKILQAHPEWKRHLRVISSLGPFPMAPVVSHQRQDALQKERWKRDLLQLHQTPEGKQALHKAGISHFETAHREQYLPLLTLEKQARKWQSQVILPDESI